jgi:hypothetical protein
MKQTFHSNWTTILLTTGGWVTAFWYGYSKYGLTQHIKLGVLMKVAFEVWMAWELFGTYLKIEDDRWLTNSSAGSESTYQIDLGSVLYIARMPHFIFRSWGGRTVSVFSQRAIIQSEKRASRIRYCALWLILKSILHVGGRENSFATKSANSRRSPWRRGLRNFALVQRQNLGAILRVAGG